MIIFLPKSSWPHTSSLVVTLLGAFMITYLVLRVYPLGVFRVWLMPALQQAVSCQTAQLQTLLRSLSLHELFPFIGFCILSAWLPQLNSLLGERASPYHGA